MLQSFLSDLIAKSMDGQIKKIVAYSHELFRSVQAAPDEEYHNKARILLARYSFFTQIKLIQPRFRGWLTDDQMTIYAEFSHFAMFIFIYNTCHI